MTRIALLALLFACLSASTTALAQEDFDLDAIDAELEAEEEAAARGELDLDAIDAEVDAEDDFNLDELDAIDAGEDEGEWGEGEDDEGPPVLPVFGATTFSATSTTVAQYRFDNFNANVYDDDFFAFWERFEFAMQGEKLRLNARLDAFVPLGTSDCPEGSESLCFLKYDVRLERFTLHYEDDGLKLDMGDSYAVFGRGIALSLRRVDQLGFDSPLRGGQVAHTMGRATFRVLGGAVNPQNLDPAVLRIIDTPADQLRRGFDAADRDWILGTALELKLGANNEVLAGMHHVRTWFATDSIGRENDVNIAGAYVSAPALLDGSLALYLEGNAVFRRQKLASTDPTRSTGHAFYGSAQFQTGNLSLLLEWKDYDNFSNAPSNLTGDSWRFYSAAPPLERDEERYRGIHHSRGGRLQIDYGFLPGPWSVSATLTAYGWAEDIEQDPWDGILVTHVFAKLQRINNAVSGVGWSFDLYGGYRRESYLHDPPGDEVGQWGLDWQVIHATTVLGLVINQHSIELTVNHRQERQLTFDYVNFVRGYASLTWSIAGKLRISPTLNWNTEKAGTPSLYPGLEVRWDFASGSFLRLFGGQTPGGRVCSGGVCRDVPEFQGVLGELVIRL